jgi:hypothetical protein
MGNFCEMCPKHATERVEKARKLVPIAFRRIGFQRAPAKKGRWCARNVMFIEREFKNWIFCWFCLMGWKRSGIKNFGANEISPKAYNKNESKQTSHPHTINTPNARRSSSRQQQHLFIFINYSSELAKAHMCVHVISSSLSNEPKTIVETPKDPLE